MTNLVTLKAELCIALERVMVVASAQNAVQSGALVGTFPGYVTKFVTSSTLYRWIRPKIVARALLLKFTKHIIDLILSLLFILTLHYVII